MNNEMNKSFIYLIINSVISKISPLLFTILLFWSLIFSFFINPIYVISLSLLWVISDYLAIHFSVSKEEIYKNMLFQILTVILYLLYLLILLTIFNHVG